MTIAAFTALVLLGSTACSREGSSEGETAGTTTSHDSTTEASTTIDDTSESGMMGTETDDGPDDTNTAGGSFYAVPEDISSTSSCDPFFQDCPEGEKCVPYASAGATWDANKCVPIVGDGQPGDACISGGIVDATDDCDGTGICWNTALIEGELVGTCTPFCMGMADNPECSEGSSCVIANNGSINLCLASCDPLAQDCPDQQGCQWGGIGFVCLSGPDGPPNQPCDELGECPAGSTCVGADLVPGCMGASCCTEFCSISEPTCVEPTSECVPFFEEPPAGYEDIGICVAP